MGPTNMIEHFNCVEQLWWCAYDGIAKETDSHKQNPKTKRENVENNKILNVHCSPMAWYGMVLYGLWLDGNKL